MPKIHTATRVTLELSAEEFSYLRQLLQNEYLSFIESPSGYDDEHPSYPHIRDSLHNALNSITIPSGPGR